jgi:hypothetical protein
MSTLPTIDAPVQFKTPVDLAIALMQRNIAVPCVLKVGKDAWTVRDYEHASRMASGILLASADGWEEQR